MSRPRRQLTRGGPSSGRPDQLDLIQNGTAKPANERQIQPIPIGKS
jgi:hypothetical protein